MAENHFHPPQARMLNNLSNQISMCSNDFMELAWEDGRILTKPHSRATQKISPTFTSSNHTDIRRESTEGNRSNENAERLGPVSLTSFYGSKNLLQPDNGRKDMGTILGCSHNLPQEAYSQWYGHGLTSESVYNKSRIYDKNHLIGNYGMAVFGSTNPGVLNGSSVILKEVPESTTGPMSSHRQGQQTPVSFLSSGPSTRLTPYSGDGVSNSEILKESEARNMNFSYFFRQRSRLAKPGSTENIPTINMGNKKSSLAGEFKTAHDMSAPRSSRGLDDPTGFQEKQDVVSNKKVKPAYVNNVEERAVPDEQSEAAGLLDSLRVEKSNDQSLYPFSNQEATADGKTANDEEPDEVPVASSSICSRGASNNLAWKFEGGYEESEPAYASENDTEETDEAAIAKVPVRENGGTKRKRSAVHNLSERKRRDRINKKMRALQELLPNCNKKMDKASVLDEAIDYLKTLQLQLQIMSAGNPMQNMSAGARFFMPPMMLPAAMQQLRTPHMNQLPPMGIGMGMRMDGGVGPSTSQLPTAPFPGGTLLLGNGGGGFQMLGFQPMPGLPFIPFIGQPSMPVVAPSISTLTNTAPCPTPDPRSSSNETDNGPEQGNLRS